MRPRLRSGEDAEPRGAERQGWESLSEASLGKWLWREERGMGNAECHT